MSLQNLTHLTKLPCELHVRALHKALDAQQVHGSRAAWLANRTGTSLETARLHLDGTTLPSFEVQLTYHEVLGATYSQALLEPFGMVVTGVTREEFQHKVNGLRELMATMFAELAKIQGAAQ